MPSRRGRARPASRIRHRKRPGKPVMMPHCVNISARASGSIALNKRGAPAVETACHAARAPVRRTCRNGATARAAHIQASHLTEPMDEQQKHSESQRPAAPASQPSSSGDPDWRADHAAGMVKRHRGRNIALIVAALVILGRRAVALASVGRSRRRRERREPAPAAQSGARSGGRGGRGGAWPTCRSRSMWRPPRKAKCRWC